jgi:hypothetical protein
MVAPPLPPWPSRSVATASWTTSAKSLVKDTRKSQPSASKNWTAEVHTVRTATSSLFTASAATLSNRTRGQTEAGPPEGGDLKGQARVAARACVAHSSTAATATECGDPSLTSQKLLRSSSIPAAARERFLLPESAEAPEAPGPCDEADAMRGPRRLASSAVSRVLLVHAIDTSPGSRLQATTTAENRSHGQPRVGDGAGVDPRVPWLLQPSSSAIPAAQATGRQVNSPPTTRIANLLGRAWPAAAIAAAAPWAAPKAGTPHSSSSSSQRATATASALPAVRQASMLPHVDDTTVARPWAHAREGLVGHRATTSAIASATAATRPSRRH